MGTEKYLGEVIGHSVYNGIKKSDRLLIPDGKIGIEIEFEHWNGIKPAPQRMWEHHPDEGSVRNHGTEFVTIGDGIAGDAVIKSLEGFCETAKANKWSEGYPRAAIHIHLDVTNLNIGEGELARLVTNYMLVEHIFFGFAGEWRRECGFCVPYSTGQEDFARIGAILFDEYLIEKNTPRLREWIRNLSKYQALNLNPIERFGTVEFRHLPTTFDVERILTWINMIFALKNATQSNYLKDPLRALSTLGAEAVARTIFTPQLYDRELSQYLNPGAMWEACDNCVALLAQGGKIKHNKNHSEAWDALDPSNMSPLLKKKKEYLNGGKRKMA